MKRKLIGTLLLVILCILYFCIQNQPLESKNGIFVDCIDGDTAVFLLDQKETKVRFLAIDAPEIDTTFGKEVASYVCNVLKKSEKIHFEFEETASKDKYGRTLAWVYVDDQLLQKILVEQGYAEVKYIYDDYKYVEQLENLQKQAKEKKLGIWK